MSPWVISWLGAITVDLPKRNRGWGKVPGLLLSDIMLILGVGLAILLLLGLASYLWMKSRQRRHRHVSGGEKVYRGVHDESDSETAELADEAAEPEGEEDDESEPEHSEGQHHHHHHHRQHGRRRYKYRVRRRSHRSRNPTLSETGGLPPVKTHEPEPGQPC